MVPLTYKLYFFIELAIMKNSFLILIILTSTLIGQDLKISIHSSLTTTLSEDIRNAVNYKPIDQYIYFYGADFRLQPIEEIPIYTGLNYQYGNKSVFTSLIFLQFSIKDIDIEYIRTKRKVSLSILKIPVTYSISLSEFVSLNPGFYIGWEKFELKNSGDLITDTGDKYTQINDNVIKERIFIEPSLELAVILFKNINFNFEVSYKNYEHSIDSDFENMEVSNGIIDFATEKYKYKIKGFFFTVGFGINI